MSAQTDIQPVALDVVVTNFPKTEKPRSTERSTVKTWLINIAADPKYMQISDYEPNRLRMLVQAIDAPIVLMNEPPGISPDPTVAGTAPVSGALIPNTNLAPTVVLGPDAWWVNSTSNPTRVTVIKEYC